MKYLGKITDPKDLVTKEYVDNNIPATAPVQSVNEQTGTVGFSCTVTFDEKGEFK